MGEFTKNQYKGEDCLKSKGLGQFLFCCKPSNSIYLMGMKQTEDWEEQNKEIHVCNPCLQNNFKVYFCMQKKLMLH